MKDGKKNYGTTQKDFLTVLWPMLMLCPYVEGSRFMVRTDHQFLKCILALQSSTGWLARWRLHLMELDIEVQHRPGEKHMVVDAVSWLPTNQTDDSDFDDDSLAYAGVNSHDDPDKRDKNEQTLLTIKRFIATQREVAYCHHLVEKSRRSQQSFLIRRIQHLLKTSTNE